MQTLWSNALNAANVSLKDDMTATDTWISCLDDMAALQVMGPDAAKFLQGQLSCDIKAVSNTRALPGSHCNPQGRMLSNFRVLNPAEQHYVLVLRSDLSELAQKALQKYIVFSKAKLDKVEGLAAFGLHGLQAATLVETYFSALPGQQNNAVSNENGIAVQIDQEGKSFELYLDPEATEVLANILSKAIPCDKSYWEQQRFSVGLWYIDAAQSGEHIPLVTGLEKIDGISFKKGCYTGQEIIARLHYRGKAKRHLENLSAEGNIEVNIGDKVVDAESGNELGEIVAIARTKKLTSLLAILNLAADEARPALKLHHLQGPHLA